MQLTNTKNTIQVGKYLTPTTDSTRKEKLGFLTYRWWKAILDRVLAILIIVVSSPLMAIITICIWLDSPGKVVYHRDQIGQNGRPFKAYKFRTMHVDNNDYEYKKYLMKYVLENAPYQTKSGTGTGNKAAPASLPTPVPKPSSSLGRR